MADPTIPNETPQVEIIYEYDVFISYSFDDGKDVSVICDYLEQAGLRCFLAERNMPKGVHFSDIIPWAIEHSRMVLAVMSQKFNDSRHTSREIVIAFDRQVPVLPVKLEECRLTNTKEYYLTPLVRIDATKSVVHAMPEIEAACRKTMQDSPKRKMAPDKAVPSKKTWYKSHARMLNSTIMLIIILGVFFLIFQKVPDIVSTSPQPVPSDSTKTESEVTKSIPGLMHNAVTIARREKIKRNTVESLKKAIDMGDSNVINLRMLDFLNDLDKLDPQVAVNRLDTIFCDLKRFEKVLTDTTKRKLHTTVASTRDRVNISSSEYKRSCYQLGILYYYGIGTKDRKPEPEKAIGLFQASKDEEDANLYLGLCYMKTEKEDNAKEVLAEAGGTVASYYLNRLTFAASQTKYNKKTEDDYLTNTEETAVARGIDSLQRKYDIEYPIKRLSSWELEIIEKASKYEDANAVWANHALGVYYYNKYKDRQKALPYLNRANELASKNSVEDKLKNKITQNLEKVKKKG